VAGGVAERAAPADRGWSARDLIAAWPRRAAATAVVGFLVGSVVGGLGGRLAMRILTITSDDRLRGFITDDDARVNQFTLAGTLSLMFFLGLGGVAVAFVYLALREAGPADRRARAAITAVLFWGYTGSTVFDPDGFDFTRLTPHWLGVLLFTALFAAVGVLLALGVERALEQWPSTGKAALPALVLVPLVPLLVLALASLATAELVARVKVVRLLGAAVVVLAIVRWVPPTLADVVRILT
jgi:hypothetical protein